MRALVIANCTTQTYVEALKVLFPDWDVRGVAEDRADQWIRDGTRPDFVDFLGSCDVFVGEPADGRRFGEMINENAERVLIPGLYFRGLHPDIATVPGLRGPLSFTAPNPQCSLIMLAAYSLDLDIARTAQLFCGDVYRELGFFDLYQSEKRRLLERFAAFHIDLSDEFGDWERSGDFFLICHHPRVAVLTDILRRALRGRYLDPAGFAASKDLLAGQVDHLRTMEIWPVYPEIAESLGFRGSLNWIVPARPATTEIALEGIIDATFKGLAALAGDWRSLNFVRSAASVIQGHMSGASSLPAAARRGEILESLAGDERRAVEAALEAPYDPELSCRAVEVLRNARKLAELDRFYASAPRAVQCDHAVISVWCSVPRITNDGPELMRRAEAMRRIYPNDAKSFNHMIFALHATAGFDETMRHAEEWMIQFPDSLDILGPTATVALWSEKYDVAESIYRRLEKVQAGGLEAGSYRMLIIALQRQKKDAVAAQTLTEARAKYPGSDVLADL